MTSGGSSGEGAVEPRSGAPEDVEGPPDAPHVFVGWRMGPFDATDLSLLGPSERERLGRIANEQAAAEFVASRQVLRGLLSYLEPAVEPADWRFTVDARGKPCVDASAHPEAPHFNLSHTSGCVVVAASHGAEVGVDVEHLGRRVRFDALIERFFAPEERAWLSALPTDERRRRFFDVWTLKEAAIKLRGDALASGIGAVVLLPGDGPAGLSPRVYEPTTFHRWELGDHVVALAVAGSHTRLEAVSGL